MSSEESNSQSSDDSISLNPTKNVHTVQNGKETSINLIDSDNLENGGDIFLIKLPQEVSQLFLVKHRSVLEKSFFDLN